MESSPENSNGFQLHSVLYEEVAHSVKTLQNDCSAACGNIPTMFIKPVAYVCH